MSESFIQELIRGHRLAIRYYLAFGIGIFLLGIVIVLIVIFSSGGIFDDKYKSFMGLGGGFVSSLSGLQLKEIIIRKEKISILDSLKGQLRGEGIGEEERERIDTLITKIVEKMISG